MEQKIPDISTEDIERIAKRDFSQFDFVEIERILSMYESESLSRRNRVYASILKLSNGNIELVKEYIISANNDYRDVLALAEYSSYSEHAFEDDLTAEDEQKLIEDDWVQYNDWLNRT